MFQETKDIHTRLLRLGLAVEESRAYWRTCDPAESRPLAKQRAFEERWFGAKSSKRVDYLLYSLGLRFQGALAALKAWDPIEKQDRCWVCHFHLQLTDPLYRRFTVDYLAQRMQRSEPSIEKLSALQWLESVAPNRWAAATAERLVSGLSSSLTEAGFCRGKSSPREIVIPPISDQALSYLLYLLKHSEYQGSLLDNPYIQSTCLGLELDRRLHKLPGFTYQRQGKIQTLSWQHKSFADWLASR